MAKVNFHDRAKMEGVSISGTSAFDPTTGTAPAGFSAFVDGVTPSGDIALLDGDLYPLVIVNTSNSEWEVGFYQWSSATTNFLRGSGGSFVTASSQSGSAVSFTAGSDKTVMVVDPVAAKTIVEVASSGRFVDVLMPTNDSFSGGIVTQGDVPIRAEVFDDGQRSQAERSVVTMFTSDGTETTAASILIPLAVSVAVVNYRVIVQENSFLESSPFAAKVVEGRFATMYDGSSRTLLGTPTQSVVGEDSAVSSASIAINQSASVTEINVTGLASTDLVWSVVMDVFYQNTET